MTSLPSTSYPSILMKASNMSCSITLYNTLIIETAVMNKNGHYVTKFTKCSEINEAVEKFNKAVKAQIRKGNDLDTKIFYDLHAKD